MTNKNSTVEITTFLLGPIKNNSFLVTDPASHEAVVIDPSFNIQCMLDHIRQHDMQVKYILITHAHVDHLAGVSLLLDRLPVRPHLALHRSDLDLWKDRGEALQYGFQLDPLPDPDCFIQDGENLPMGSFQVTAHHTPGHSPGHVVFAIPQANVIFVGDVIFAGSIGRTDLTGGNLDELLNSIQKTILSYPDETLLLPGHGPETTVGFECLNNPYLL
jgi:hydroxyacylglutathione hydrolase